MGLQVTIDGVRSAFRHWADQFSAQMTLADTIKKKREGVPAERPARQAA
jgi:hypothetical protein